MSKQVMLRCDMVEGEQFDSVVPRSSLSTCFAPTTIATVVLLVTQHQTFASSSCCSAHTRTVLHLLPRTPIAVTATRLPLVTGRLSRQLAFRSGFAQTTASSPPSISSNELILKNLFLLPCLLVYSPDSPPDI